MQQTTLLAGIIPSAKKLSTWSWTVFENWQTTVPDTMACFFRVFFCFRFQSQFAKTNGVAVFPFFFDNLLARWFRGLQGFCVYNACGGGTGSGLGCLMLERLSVT